MILICYITYSTKTKLSYIELLCTILYKNISKQVVDDIFGASSPQSLFGAISYVYVVAKLLYNVTQFRDKFY